MPLVVWRFSDGKAGHDNQTRGLAEALARLRPVEVITLEPLPPFAALKGLSLGRQLGWNEWPAPDLLLGAGHRTHLSLLAARRIRGGKIVVLMRPSLPLGLFDEAVYEEEERSILGGAWLLMYTDGLLTEGNWFQADVQKRLVELLAECERWLPGRENEVLDYLRRAFLTQTELKDDVALALVRVQ